MTLYVVQHPDIKDTPVRAGRMVVLDGHLYAAAYSSTFDPAKDEALASWAPGKWVSFTQASRCPTCGAQGHSLQD